jgi:hypothetical protein
METVVRTRGHSLPLALLASRLICLNCGDRNIKILFEVPGNRIFV